MHCNWCGWRRQYRFLCIILNFKFSKQILGVFYQSCNTNIVPAGDRIELASQRENSNSEWKWYAPSRIAMEIHSQISINLSREKSVPGWKVQFYLYRNILYCFCVWWTEFSWEVIQSTQDILQCASVMC